MLRSISFSFIILISTTFSLVSQSGGKILTENDVKTGADQTEKYLPLLKGKKVAIVANQTSVIRKTHLVDSLLSLKVNVVKIFCPEHGFRGEADAGESVASAKDKKTGLPIISLYGKNNKPLPADLKGIDVIVYDIQDVGVRFYTYVSTMTYCMEAAAENKKKFIVLDRPNPNGFYVDGPVLDLKFKSFLGLHPVPLVYGMTIGEYASMLNGEGWLSNGAKADLEVIKVVGYTHADKYQLPVKPSPNLPNMKAVYLYPSLGLFEGTIVSVGRGTDLPFQVIGHPDIKGTKFSFTPKPNSGAKSPKYEGQVCFGYDFRNFVDEFLVPSRQIYLFWLDGAYQKLKRDNFFDENFNYHAGNDQLKKQIINGVNDNTIRLSWKKDLDKFLQIRKKYLLYPDFED